MPAKNLELEEAKKELSFEEFERQQQMFEDTLTHEEAVTTEIMAELEPKPEPELKSEPKLELEQKPKSVDQESLFNNDDHDNQRLAGIKAFQDLNQRTAKQDIRLTNVEKAIDYSSQVLKNISAQIDQLTENSNKLTEAVTVLGKYYQAMSQYIQPQPQPQPQSPFQPGFNRPQPNFGGNGASPQERILQWLTVLGQLQGQQGQQGQYLQQQIADVTQTPQFQQIQHFMNWASDIVMKQVELAGEQRKQSMEELANIVKIMTGINKLSKEGGFNGD